MAGAKLPYSARAVLDGRDWEHSFELGYEPCFSKIFLTGPTPNFIVAPSLIAEITG